MIMIDVNDDEDEVSYQIARQLTLIVTILSFFFMLFFDDFLYDMITAFLKIRQLYF